MTDERFAEAKALCNAARTAPQTHAVRLLALVPALLDEIERLRAERDEAIANRNQMVELRRRDVQLIGKLEADIAALRDADLWGCP